MRISMKAATAALVVAVPVLLAGAGAWACVPGGGGGSGKKLTVSPAQVRPGDQVTVSAPSSTATTPIDIRLNALDGPLLGSILPGAAAAGANRVSTTVAVPPDTMPGQNALIAIQAGQRWDPVALAVALPDGTVPDSPQYAAPNLSRDDASGRRTLMWAIIGFAVLGLGAVAAGAISRSSRSRRHSSPTVQESAGKTASGASLPIHAGRDASSNAVGD